MTIYLLTEKIFSIWLGNLITSHNKNISTLPGLYSNYLCGSKYNYQAKDRTHKSSYKTAKICRQFWIYHTQ